MKFTGITHPYCQLVLQFCEISLWQGRSWRKLFYSKIIAYSCLGKSYTNEEEGLLYTITAKQI